MMTTASKADLLGLLPEELVVFLRPLCRPAYRAPRP